MSDRRAAFARRVPTISRTALGAVARAALIPGVGSLVTVVVLHWVGSGISPVAVVGTFLAVRLLIFAVTRAAPARTVVDGRRGPTDPDREYAYRFDEEDLLRSAVRRWEQRLEWSDEDPDRFALIVRPVMAEMVDERLRAHHGVTLESNPARARELLAPELWQLLSDPAAPPPVLQDWPAYVRALKRL